MQTAFTDNISYDIEQIVAMIHNGDATLQTFLDLAAFLDRQPHDVLAACNRRPPEQTLSFLEACPQPQLRLLIHELFFQHIEHLEGINLRKALAMLITRSAAERTRYWQTRLQAAPFQPTSVNQDIVDYYVAKQRYAETQARYAHQEEIIKRIEQLEAERRHKEARLAHLKEDTSETVLQEHIRQLEDEYREWTERSDELKTEQDSMINRIARERRQIYKLWEMYIDALEKNAERLKHLREFSGTLDDEQQELVQERDELKRLFVDKGFRDRLKALFEELNDMHHKLLEREYIQRIRQVLYRWSQREGNGNLS